MSSRRLVPAERADSVAASPVPYLWSKTWAHSSSPPEAIKASNRASSTNSYSRPLFSFARRCRVVYETENVRPGTASRRRRASVLFPVPDGAEITNSVPRSLRSIRLLQVLDLLANLFGLGLQVERVAADAVVDGLARHRVRLPVDLLQQELEALADGLAVVLVEQRQ